jgi:hypothetical protein
MQASVGRDLQTSLHLLYQRDTSEPSSNRGHYVLFQDRVSKTFLLSSTMEAKLRATKIIPPEIEVMSVPSDGHCLFRCLALATGCSVQDVRTMAIDSALKLCRLRLPEPSAFHWILSLSELERPPLRRSEELPSVRFLPATGKPAKAPCLPGLCSIEAAADGTYRGFVVTHDEVELLFSSRNMRTLQEQGWNLVWDENYVVPAPFNLRYVKAASLLLVSSHLTKCHICLGPRPFLLHGYPT